MALGSVGTRRRSPKSELLQTVQSLSVSAEDQLGMTTNRWVRLCPSPSRSPRPQRSPPRRPHLKRPHTSRETDDASPAERLFEDLTQVINEGFDAFLGITGVSPHRSSAKGFPQYDGRQNGGDHPHQKGSGSSARPNSRPGTPPSAQSANPAMAPGMKISKAINATNSTPQAWEESSHSLIIGSSISAEARQRCLWLYPSPQPRPAPATVSVALPAPLAPSFEPCSRQRSEPGHRSPLQPDGTDGQRPWSEAAASPTTQRFCTFPLDLDGCPACASIQRPSLEPSPRSRPGFDPRRRALPLASSLQLD